MIHTRLGVNVKFALHVSFMVINQKYRNKTEFVIWHDRLGHPVYVMM